MRVLAVSRAVAPAPAGHVARQRRGRTRDPVRRRGHALPAGARVLHVRLLPGGRYRTPQQTSPHLLLVLVT